MSKPISSADVLEIAALRTQPALHRYFFSKISSPEWIEPLRRSGFFDKPPEPEQTERGVAYQPWPESHFLARITRDCNREQQEKIASILLGVPDKGNYYVRMDLLDALLAMPADLAKNGVERVLSWLPSDDRFLLPERAGQLMAHLADGGCPDKALVLARALLRLQTDKEKTDADDSWSRTEPKPVYEQYAFEQVVEKYFPRVVAAAGVEALSVLCEALHEGLRYFKVSYVRGDNSDLNISAVESIDRILYPDALAALVAAIRDAGQTLVETSKATVMDAVGVLVTYKARIFLRLAMHLLAKWPEKAPGEVGRFLLNRARFRDPEMIPEYRQLLRAGFHLLADDKKRQMLGWLRRSPSWVKVDFTGQPVSLDRRKRWTARWRLDRLRPIADELDEGWHAKYDDLVEEYGTLEEPPVRSGAVRGVRPVSPLTESELVDMSIPEIAAFLTSWKPPSREGWEPPQDITEVLTRVVSKRALEFAAGAKAFSGQKPDYVRALLSGIKGTLKTQTSADWGPLLELCTVVSVPHTPEPNEETSKQADESRWTYMAIASLLEAGLRTSSFALGEREKIWLLIERLSSHPNPAKEEDARFWNDAYTTAINSVRSLGIQAAIEFGLWYLRATKGDSGGEADGRVVLDDLPQLRRLLDAHLDPGNDPSGAVRSVYGQLYPWLIVLDKNWAKARTSDIFPLEEEHRYLLDSAWSSFLRFSQAFDVTLCPLRLQYLHAVDSIGHTKLAVPARLDDLDHYLAEHLMFYMWRGVLELQDPLLTAFWEKSNPGLRRFALDFIGRVFRDAKENIPAEVIDRARSFWSARMQGVLPTVNCTEELAAFGTWFGSGKFEARWSLDQLREVLEVIEEVDDIMRVMERLAQLASTYPRDCVSCLAYINKKGRSTQYIVTVREKETRAILTAAYQSSDAQARQDASLLVSELVSAGYYDYRDIVRPPGSNYTE